MEVEAHQVVGKKHTECLIRVGTLPQRILERLEDLAKEGASPVVFPGKFDYHYKMQILRLNNDRFT